MFGSMIVMFVLNWTWIGDKEIPSIKKLKDLRQCRVKKEKKMPGWLLLLMFFAAYFVIMRWVLPKLGVQT